MADTPISQVPAITDEQKILVGVEARTEGTTANPDGKPAKIDGAFKWEVLEGDVTLETVSDSDSKSERKIVGVTPNSTYQVQASADADLGEGVTTISRIFAGVVTEAGAAEVGGVTIGTPEQQ